MLILFLVLVSEFVVVAIFAEWWSVPTTVGTSSGITTKSYIIIIIVNSSVVKI